MRRFTSNMVGTSLIAVALSIFTVGVVWAGSSAMQIFVDDSTDTSVPTEGEVPELTPGDPLSPEELTALVLELSTKVDELQEKVDAYESDITAARESATKATAAADAATDAAEDAKTQVTSVVKRTSKLNEEGVYTGTITPNQLSRKLTASDLSGDWPLDRTNGELNGEKIKVSGSSCWTDYRYNILVTPDTFRGLTCLKVLKQ
jgi:outer membrane murein-binding lipoprotein Lpp